MASVNKVILIGNLGKDPEIKYSQAGNAVVKFSIACTEEWKAKDGSKKEKTEWINIVAFNRLAEVCGEYLKKGQQVYIEGKYRTQEYERDGQKHYPSHVEAHEMKMLGSKPGNQNNSQNISNDSCGDDIPF